MVTTEYIHGWREISYLEVMDESNHPVKKLASVNTLTIDREKDLGFTGREETYRLIPGSQMVRSGLLDVSPVKSTKNGAKVTSNKASCYSCHSSIVKSFRFRSATEARRTFSKPFKNKGEFYRNEPYYEKIKANFVLWHNKYITQPIETINP